MRIINKLLIFVVIGAMTSTAYGFETKTFIGLDSVAMETTVKYSNGSETYEFTGTRLRYGLEIDTGGSFGLEFISGVSDEVIDPFGDLFRLEIEDTIGIYLTAGKPFYFRVAWSFWNTKYTDVTSGVTDEDKVNSLEYGLGINYSLASNVTIYADYAV